MIRAYPDHMVPFLRTISEVLFCPLTNFAYISARLINGKCLKCGKPILCIHVHVVENGKITMHKDIHVCSDNCRGVSLLNNRTNHEDGKCGLCDRYTEEDSDAIINDGED